MRSQLHGNRQFLFAKPSSKKMEQFLISPSPTQQQHNRADMAVVLRIRSNLFDQSLCSPLSHPIIKKRNGYSWELPFRLLVHTHHQPPFPPPSALVPLCSVEAACSISSLLEELKCSWILNTHLRSTCDGRWKVHSRRTPAWRSTSAGRSKEMPRWSHRSRQSIYALVAQ